MSSKSVIKKKIITYLCSKRAGLILINLFLVNKNFREKRDSIVFDVHIL